jgi:hypothetical protein
VAGLTEDDQRRLPAGAGARRERRQADPGIARIVWEKDGEEHNHCKQRRLRHNVTRRSPSIDLGSQADRSGSCGEGVGVSPVEVGWDHVPDTLAHACPDSKGSRIVGVWHLAWVGFESC